MSWDLRAPDVEATRLVQPLPVTAMVSAPYWPAWESGSAFLMWDIERYGPARVLLRLDLSAGRLERVPLPPHFDGVLVRPFLSPTT